MFVVRSIKPSDYCSVDSHQLHHFADASEMGYACVSYLRVQSGKEVHCAFIFGETHVSPLKRVTIPRLELAASAYAVKVHNLVAAPFVKQVSYDRPQNRRVQVLLFHIRFL